MSRTDKDDPRWVRALHDPTAVFMHNWTCEDHLPRPGWRPCAQAFCSYWSSRHSEPRRFRWSLGPGRERLHCQYYVPERQSVRRATAAAVREYNAYGDTDAEPAVQQHRYAPWGGGYWD